MSDTTTIVLAVDSRQVTIANAALDNMTAAFNKATPAIDKEVAALQLAAASTGLNSREAALLKLTLEGATKAQLDSANAAIKQAEAFELGGQIGSALKVGLVAIAAAAVGATAAFQSLIKDAGAFQDLSDSTGASAESLASLSVAASVANVSMTTVAGAMNILSRNLTGVDDDSKAAGAALKALNIPIDEFKKLDPTAQYLAVASALDKYADGSEKVAVAQALFGRGGAEQLKLMKEINAEGGVSVILTQRQTAIADEYGDAQAKAAAKLRLYAAAALTEALPAVQALSGAATDGIKALFGLDKAGATIGINQGVQDFAFGGAKALGFLVDAADGVTRAFELSGKTIAGYAAVTSNLIKLNIAGAKEAGQAYREDVEKIVDAPLFSERLQANIDKAKAAIAAPAAAVPALPELKYNGRAKAGRTALDDDSKKLVDNQTKLIEDGLKRENDALSASGRAFDAAYARNLLSSSDYYDKKKNLQDAALLNDIASYNNEIAILEKLRASQSKATDRAETDGKIQALRQKEADAIQKNAEAASAAADKQQRDQEDFAKALSNVDAQVLELSGHLAQAAGIKFDNANKGLKDLISKNGSADDAKNLQTLRDYTIATAEFSEQASASAKVTDALAASEQRISIAQQLGAIGELEALKQLGDARQDAVKKLEAIASAEDAIARASGSPVLIKQADAARLALEKLQATANPLADRINTIFESSFGNAFADFITGAKTASEAFQSFAKSVVSALANIAAQKLAQTLFSGSSGSGGLLGLFDGGAAAGGSGVVSGGTGISFVPAGASLGAPHALGGPVSPKGLYPVNERGPELLTVGGKQYLLNGNASGSITPNNKVGGTVVDNSGQVFNIGQGVSRAETFAAINQAIQASEARMQRRQAQQGS